VAKVAWDYIVKVTMPKDLQGVEPGKLADRLLRPAVGGGKLHWLAAQAWAAMVAAAKKDGVELKPTSAGDTYRTYDSQKSGFLQRYQLEPIPGQSTKDFEGKKWYLKKGMAMLATPGKSQHNLGLAVDVHSASEPKRLNWLIANVKTYGFSWEVVPSEPWHLRYVCGDNLPDAVKAFAAGEPGMSTPPPPPAPGENAKPPADNESPSALKPGDKGPKVKKLQEVLKSRGLFPGVVNGEYGPSTADAVEKVKAQNALPKGPVAGPKVLSILGL
jgi:hypothetical protein